MQPLARLKRRSEFLRVAGKGRRSVRPGLILQALKRDEGDGGVVARVGFTASRKVGIAVIRNRSRRRLKAAVEQILRPHAAPGHDYVLVARAETPRRAFPALLGDLEAALKQCGTWRAGDAM
jgi:ribonuclease P protein component